MSTKRFDDAMDKLALPRITSKHENSSQAVLLVKFVLSMRGNNAESHRYDECTTSFEHGTDAESDAGIVNTQNC